MTPIPSIPEAMAKVRRNEIRVFKNPMHKELVSLLDELSAREREVRVLRRALDRSVGENYGVPSGAEDSTIAEYIAQAEAEIAGEEGL